MAGGSTKRVKLESPNGSTILSKRSRVKKEVSLCSSDKLVDLTSD